MAKVIYSSHEYSQALIGRVAHSKMIQCGIIFINLFNNYFSINDFNDSENACQNSVTYITHHTERKGPRYGILLLKSQNNLSKKGPLEVIYSNLQFKAGN